MIRVTVLRGQTCPRPRGGASRPCYRRAVILREVPGLPPADVRPPIVAESGDPFAELRVTHLLARIPRGTPVRIGVDGWHKYRVDPDVLEWPDTEVDELFYGEPAR